MKKLFTLFISLLLLLSGTIIAQTTVTINPSKDNTLFEDGLGFLSAGADPGFFAGKTNLNLIRRGLIMFDIAANVPAGSLITDVTLTLQSTQITTGTNPVSIHTLNNDWGEAGSVGIGTGGGIGGPAQTDDATWIHTFYDTLFWNNPGGDYNPTASATTNVGGSGSYVWTSSQMMIDVQNWLGNPGANFGWILIGDETVNQTTKRFASKENPNISIWPSLSVTFIAPCTAPDIPFLTASGTGNCAGDLISISVSGNLNDATHWTLYEDSCGGSPVNISAAGIFNVFPTTTTTYYVRGEGGCVTPDSCGSLSLGITVVDTSVTQTMATLIANTSNATYQWVNCDSSYAPISGATNQSFNPSVNGNYAVIITVPLNCSDTSSCHNVVIIGVSETKTDNTLNVFPNPFKDKLSLVFEGNTTIDLQFQLLNSAGKIIRTAELSEQKEFDTSSLSPGIYLILVIDKKNYKTLAEQTVIKQ